MGKKLAQSTLVVLIGLIASLIAIYSFITGRHSINRDIGSKEQVPRIVPTMTQITASPPIIDSIGLPKTIVCDKRRYDIPIKFHDPDGDAHRIYWQLLYSKKETTLYTDAKEFYIDSEKQKNGATYNDFIEWYVPGDEVTIRVFIEDRTELTGQLDFEFKCSN